ncbi:MAG: ACT domain-containing protein [Magnetococcales bacterium]|nr:ACT domain-containing protein [Magnetococcales bacterium]
MTGHFALLTVSGRDRPGIVAQVTRALFENGCNIEDSSMTRLCGEFAMMLVLRHDAKTRRELETALEPACAALELEWHLKLLPEGRIAAAATSASEQEFVIHILGADKPGIVYHVTQLLAEEAVNITDLCTQLAGKPGRPIYAMVIEAEVPGDPDRLQQRLRELATRLHVDITLRAADAVTL